MSFRFPKLSRLLRSSEFRTCAKRGKNVTGKFLHIQIFFLTPTKLGLTVSRRYGNAVHRNRFKRLVREAFRLTQADLPKNMHINVRPQSAAKEASFTQIKEELAHLLTHIDK